MQNLNKPFTNKVFLEKHCWLF